MSEANRYAQLAERAVVKLTGPDRRDFLQGIVSNDVRLVGPERAVHTGFLTPQGKYVHDFCLAALPGTHSEADELGGPWLLDGAAARLDDLLKRLKVYKLRAKVKLLPQRETWAVYAAWGPAALERLGLPAQAGASVGLGGGIAFVDPRAQSLGARIYLPAEDGVAPLAAAGLEAAHAEAYEAHRIACGVPDGERDAEIEKSGLLDLGFDELGSISWDKGCYLGQELTARTRYRGLLKRKLFPVTVEGPAPEPGTAIYTGSKRVGELRSVAGERGIALLRIDNAREPGAAFSAGEATVRPVGASQEAPAEDA